MSLMFPTLRTVKKVFWEAEARIFPPEKGTYIRYTHVYTAGKGKFMQDMNITDPPSSRHKLHSIASLYIILVFPSGS